MPETLIAELARLLGSAYNRPDLERVVRMKLQAELYDYAPRGETDPNTIAALVFRLHQAGRVIELVRAFQIDVPGRPDVQDLCQRFLANPPPLGPGPPPPLALLAVVARDKVVRFDERFRRCRDEIQYLNGYKELHDVLHKLQGMLEAIGQAAGRFRAQPTSKRELLVIAEALHELVLAARTGASRLLDPEDVADWLVPFEKAVADMESAVRVADLRLLDRVVEALTSLPAKQAEVNEELVKAAKRLGVDALVTLVDGILAELSGSGGAALVTGFRAGLQRFRGLCDRLTGLRVDHNNCQHVENSLGLAATLPDVTPDRVPGWADVKRRIKELAIRRPADPQAARMAASVDQFEAAAPPAATEEFFTLLIRFRGLFYRTDEDLLAVTDDLVREAELLEAQLRTLTDVPTS